MFFIGFLLPNPQHGNRSVQAYDSANHWSEGAAADASPAATSKSVFSLHGATQEIV